jgi:hypothetical protein
MPRRLIMSNAKEKTQAILNYITRLGVTHDIQEADIEKIFHKDYTLTYFGQVITKGRENLKPHFEDIFRNCGICRVKQYWLIAEGDKCVARYDFQTDKLGLVHCVAVYSFKDGLCIGQDDELLATDDQIRKYAPAATFVDNNIRA